MRVAVGKRVGLGEGEGEGEGTDVLDVSSVTRSWYEPDAPSYPPSWMWYVLPADTGTSTNEVSSSQSSLHLSDCNEPNDDPLNTPSTVSKPLLPASTVSTPAAAGTTRNQSVLPIGASQVVPSPESIDAPEVEPLRVAGSTRFPVAGNASLTWAPAAGDGVTVGDSVDVLVAMAVGVPEVAVACAVCDGVAVGLAGMAGVEVEVRVGVADAAPVAVGDGVGV